MQSLPIQVTWILEVFKEQGKELFLVGGCVRDMIMKRTISDYDMTTNATPDEMLTFLKDLPCKIIPTGVKHGTITVIKDELPIEITTYRFDGIYENHRAPKRVTFSTSLREDLARRDFTMNALAYHPIHGIIDPFHGQLDIEKSIIRCVGESHERFKEDALRMLRAIRFSFVLDFHIQEDTQQAIRTQANLLQYISKERIRSELDKMLMSDHPNILNVLRNLQVLPFILPQLQNIYAISQESSWHIYDVFTHTQVALNHTNGYCLEEKLAIICHDIGKADTKSFDKHGFAHFHNHALHSEHYARQFLTSLAYSKKVIEHVCLLIHFHDYYVTPNRRILRRFLAHFNMDYELAYAILRVQYADDCAKNMEKAQEKIDNIIACVALLQRMQLEHDALSMSDLAVNGKDLIKLGYQGKEIGVQLAKLFAIIVEDPKQNKKELLLQISKK